jgi:hypothetical protein
MATIWVCSYDNAHKFALPTDNYFCPTCPPRTGLLIETDDEDVTGGTEKEVGLCVILMDASLSMTEQAFKGNPLTKMRLVCDSAAHGIFALQRLQNNPNAVVAIFKFDDRIELMTMDSVAGLMEKFGKSEDKFANYLYQELDMMKQGTDINKALREAHTFVRQFVDKTLADFPIPKYRPMLQPILTHTNQPLTIANVRVLIYTDGEQYDANESNHLDPNPFKAFPPHLVNHDIVIGAFFGQKSDEGCQQLEGLLSPCPIHNRNQFFLFDQPSNIGDLEYLFRMASGASGFCPSCLERHIKK